MPRSKRSAINNLFFPSQERHPSYRFIFNSVAVCANGEQKSSKDLSIERYLAGEGAGAPGPRRRGHIACAIYVSYLYVTFAARMYIVLYIVLLSTAVLVFLGTLFGRGLLSFFFAFFYSLIFVTMADGKEIAALLSEADNTPAEKVLMNINLAKKEVLKVLSTTGSSFFELCSSIERARTRDGLKAAFSQFNLVLRVFLGAAPASEHDKLSSATLSVR